MTSRMKKFAEYVYGNGNATQAAIQAGYSKKTAYSIGQRLLKNVEVAEYIRKLSEKAQKERILSAMERQAILSDIIKNREEDTADRIRALDTLNKMTGEYITKVQAEVNTSEKLSDVLNQLGGKGLED